MAHLKRQGVPKTWPVKRKGTKYIVKPKSNIEESIPLLVALRDVLSICQNRKEVKKVIHEKKILINTREVKNDKNVLTLFDTLTIVPLKKNYRLIIGEKGKFEFEEISESEASQRISKVVNKTVLKGKKIQLNLRDGKNFLFEGACKPNDSVLINLKTKKIEKCLPLREKTSVTIFSGKYSGKTGTIRKLKPERKMASVVVDKKDVNVLIKQIMVIE